jgi:hypothetical protein
MEKIQVTYRNVRYPGGQREILALFPQEVGNRQGDVTCYAHMGQHSTADYKYIIQVSKPATSQEYEPLHKELMSIYGDSHLGEPVELEIVKRQNYDRYIDSWNDIR